MTSGVWGVNVASGLLGFWELMWPLPFWIWVWQLSFQVPGISGVLVPARSLVELKTSAIFVGQIMKTRERGVVGVGWGSSYQ